MAVWGGYGCCDQRGLPGAAQLDLSQQPSVNVRSCLALLLLPENISPSPLRICILKLHEPSGSHQHTWGGDFRFYGKRVQRQPGTGLSY